VAKVAAEVGSTANRYQVLAKLAAGGMAEIFLARGASVAGVERYCVLKRILRERAADAQFAQMFLDEARLAAQLQHPNIAAVYDIGMLGDSYFFTMEYVHGETVRSLLQRAQGLRRPVPLACALTIIAGTAAGLHHAHERNATDGRPLDIVHRDVSPSNLMVSYEGNVKVVDFGVAKAANRAVETSSGTVKGKIGYLSPEQCRGARVDRRSDLFSLGIVMWELLTGARLYRRASDFESMAAIVHETPSAPSLRRAELPPAVDDIVLRLLAKSVGDRFQTAAELVEAIEAASMRAGTILSTSAVARLVRDLFGVRAEPWLEIDADAPPWERPGLVSRPIPLDGARTQTEAVELELASVPGLGFAGTQLMHRDDGRSFGGPRMDPRDATLSAPNTAAASGLQVARAALAALPLPPSPSPSAQSSSMSSPSPRLTRAHRTALGVAAGIAAVVVWFVMGTEPERSPMLGAQLAAVASKPVGPPAAIASKPVEPPAAIASKPVEPPVDNAVLRADPAPPDEPAAGSAAPPRRTPAPPEPAPPERLRRASRQAVTEARAVTRIVERAPSPAVSPAPSPLPALSSPAPPPPVPRPAALPSLRALAAQYARGDTRADYRAVLSACSTALVSAEIAKLCLRAACNVRDPFEARRWLPFAADAERERAYCKARGIGPGASTLDCRHDPLDCR
jgi:serine/threonine protein kinase